MGDTAPVRQLPPPWLPAYAYQSDFISFESESAARDDRFLDWAEFNSVLTHHCIQYPQWTGSPCGDPNTCTSCKLQADEAVYNPLRLSSGEVDLVVQGLRLFEAQAFQHNLVGLLRAFPGGPPEDGITHSHKLAVQNTLNAQASQALPPALMENLKHWGYMCLRSARARPKP